MPLNFPASPIDGQTYTYGTVTYYYDAGNTVWSLARNDDTLAVSIPNWTQTTANLTASFGQCVMCDSSSNPVSITLPASPMSNPANAISIRVNSGPKANANNITIARNGSTIMSIAEDMTISDNNITVEFVYNGSTWRIA